MSFREKYIKMEGRSYLQAFFFFFFFGIASCLVIRGRMHINLPAVVADGNA